jgi:pSer/pThr/pTyr-binding forkhead associated (FHA) protein
VYWRVGGGCVIDIGSTNGTFINGIGIKAPAKLADGDELHLGQ